MSRITTLDAAKSRGNDLAVGIIEEALLMVPEIGVFGSRIVSTTNFQTLVRTGVPSVGFRAINQGFIASKSTFVNRLHQCYPFGGRIEADKQLADTWEGGATAYYATEESGITTSAWQTLGHQIWYGTGDPASDYGFQGVKNFVPKGATAKLADGRTINLTVDAQGTTANTATSVYGIKMGVKAAQLIYGQGDVFRLPPPRIETIRTTDNATGFDGYVSQMDGWVGLQLASPFCACRIVNVTDDAGHGLTDKLGELIKSYLPMGWEPDFWFMSKRGRRTLQDSRSVVINATGAKSSTGAEVYAPIPTELAGIPIIATDSILDTDAIE